jgi:hypothetical protein
MCSVWVAEAVHCARLNKAAPGLYISSLLPRARFSLRITIAAAVGGCQLRTRSENAAGKPFPFFEACHRVDAISCHGCLASATGGSTKASEPCLQLLSKFLTCSKYGTEHGAFGSRAQRAGIWLVELLPCRQLRCHNTQSQPKSRKCRRSQRSSQSRREAQSRPIGEYPTANARQLSEGHTLGCSRELYHVHVYNLAILPPSSL